ncbi:MAG: amidohydrolase, partial [Cyclobacteriaceae bacterium]|nr:amidohydrolase [Cyclobacteriaceae bacterium]
QTKNQKYIPLISNEDTPPVYLNSAIMERYKSELSKYYYDETKYDTYLEQLGITYPTIKK